MKDELSILTYGAAKAAGGGGGTGDGDMKKSVYDTNNDGVVDAADNAAKVGGHTVATDVPANAVFTDTIYDDTSITNRVSGIEEVIPEGATSSNQLATQSDLPSAVTGNPEGSATAGNLTKLQIGSDIYDVPSGGGSSDPYDGRKTRYTISSSNWSSSASSDGYYTYSLTLTNPLTTSTSPNVYIAGSGDNTEPTATEKTMFGYVKRCNLSSSTTLVLYATTKPTSTFYVFVGAEGGGMSYVDVDIYLGNLTWNTSSAGLRYAMVSDNKILPTDAVMIGYGCFYWGELPADFTFFIAQTSSDPQKLSIATTADTSHFNSNSRIKLHIGYIL